MSDSKLPGAGHDGYLALYSCVAAPATAAADSLCAWTSQLRIFTLQCGLYEGHEAYLVVTEPLTLPARTLSSVVVFTKFLLLFDA
jgi:hypothetical protein